ncbi:AraC family transcriptional regulator [Leptospira congkakensis]|uniref:AraC family transcriptional regulator n=1 Tax=Leptospira congkakensis TaxID=2484932 RepID=A0A4Z1A2R3_9LEPT|nr:effector binding domain-containing protein [Leptospira congkakensis]TGL87778.1 AraC family transcriptional regulator [Leptospira congkakensis]TGL89606.1 AraC family transcriptional regulator [Leptospira congkakensis]TGL95928.1 AraC family transcriptional regulator [Leptospira congkakensis]
MSEVTEPLVKTANFSVMGLRIRTSNAPGEADIQIPKVYSKFYKEDIPKQMEFLRKFDPLFALYFNYASDETGAYDFLLGYAVDPKTIPLQGMEVVHVEPQNGRYFQIQPGAPEEVVPKFWAEIWNHPEIPKIRTYQMDWEEYSEAGIRVFLSTK